MTEFVVTQSMIDYVKYEKKKAREQAGKAFLALFIFVAGMSSICWMVGFFR
jgi:hypothetical protein